MYKQWECLVILDVQGLCTPGEIVRIIAFIANVSEPKKNIHAKKYPKLYSQHPFWGTWMPWGGTGGSKKLRNTASVDNVCVVVRWMVI